MVIFAFFHISLVEIYGTFFFFPGGTLIIFDRLFGKHLSDYLIFNKIAHLCCIFFMFYEGTFQGETEEKVVYGLIKPVNTWNPVWIQVELFKKQENHHPLIFHANGV